MIPALFVFAYLATVLYIGIFAFRRKTGEHPAEDFFLANRSLGNFVFLMSLFGTNMTAFAILGSSGHAFSNGIVTYGLMASSSALIVPLSLFFIGTRVWSLGKRFGFMTPVQMFRDRWECSHIGTIITVVQTALLLPYIIIGVMGGGTTLYAISGGRIPFWLGGAVVALVVMSYVFFGGMRGTAWVNTFQTTLFLIFGAIALGVIGAGMGGFGKTMNEMLASPTTTSLLTREKISPLYFFSYTFIPLSSINFPHMIIFCLTAQRVQHFKKTVILYPLCMLAIWLPAVFLGVTANRATEVPAIQAKLEARQTLATGAATLSPEQRTELRAKSAGDDVLLRLLEAYAPLWLAGLLGAGIMAAVMASDSQILALSTMFTEDIFAFYEGKERFGEKAQVMTGRLFVVGLTLIAYFIALKFPQPIFDLAVSYAFSGYSALMPLMIAALFWKRSTKWGALASTLWAFGSVATVAIFQSVVATPKVIWSFGGWEVLARTPGGTSVFGLLPVVPMTIVSAILMVVVSVITAKPTEATVSRYFSSTLQHSRPNLLYNLTKPYLKKYGSATVLGGIAISMVQINEFAIAELFLTVSGIAFLAQVVTWNGVQKRPLKITIKLIGSLLIICLCVYFGRSFFISKGDKPWSTWFHNEVPKQNLSAQLASKNTSAEVTVYDPFAATYKRNFSKLGKPITSEVSQRFVYQALHENANVIWLDKGSVFYLLNLKTQQWTKRADTEVDSDPNLENEAWLGKKFFPPEGLYPPYSGVAKFWLREKEKWSWIGFRKWHCDYLDGLIHTQTFENGLIIGGLTRNPSPMFQDNALVFVLFNDGHWDSDSLPITGSTCQDPITRRSALKRTQ